MIRVVLDTNVLVAAAMSPTGPNFQVVKLIGAGRIRPYVTASVLDEYDRVFEYPRLQHLDKRRVADVRRIMKATAFKVKSQGNLKLSEHEEDNRVYECAHAAKAHYIVTENTRHFKSTYGYTRIVTARQLLNLVEAGQL